MAASGGGTPVASDMHHAALHAHCAQFPFATIFPRLNGTRVSLKKTRIHNFPRYSVQCHFHSMFFSRSIHPFLAMERGLEFLGITKYPPYKPPTNFDHEKRPAYPPTNSPPNRPTRDPHRSPKESVKSRFVHRLTWLGVRALI